MNELTANKNWIPKSQYDLLPSKSLFARNVVPKVGFVRGKACEPVTSGRVSEVRHLPFPQSSKPGNESSLVARSTEEEKRQRDECEDYRRRK